MRMFLDFTRPTYYLDVETTGLSSDDEIIEIAIVNDAGQAVFNSLIRPNRPIPAAVTRLTGITNEMVASAPSLSQVWHRIMILFGGARVVIYNKAFDRRFFPDELDCADEVVCAMRAYRVHARESGIEGSAKLERAAQVAGFRYDGRPHRALTDALATRAVWNFVHDTAASVQPSLFDALEPAFS